MTTDDERTLNGFRRLPLLVPLGVFCHWTGWNRKTVGRLVKSGRVRVVTPTNGKRKFYKTDLAKLCGLDW